MLENFRKDIDEIDQKLLKLIEDRVRIVKQVGEYKKQDVLEYRSIIRPGREAQMIRKIADMENSMLPTLPLAQMWRIIISSSINIEEPTNIATYVPHGNRECYWLSREYFGSFTPTTMYPTTMEVVHAVENRRATVGALTIADLNSPHPWWSRLTNLQNPPKIFAVLPFIKLAPSKRPTVVTIGYVDPEDTGNDTSLWIVESNDFVSVKSIRDSLKSMGKDFQIKDSCQVPGKRNVYHNLIAIDGFIDENDEFKSRLKDKIKASTPKSAATSCDIFYLGSYANPVKFYESEKS